MTTDQHRRERVANGSRRRRDLAATSLGFSKQGWTAACAWAERELPDEPFAAVSCMTFAALNGHHPTKDQVLQRLKEQGRDKATLDRRLS